MHEDEWEKSYVQGLAFFGRISANISHEVKNHLAVINELGGLLQDLTLMAGEKDNLDPVRVQGAADNIVDQVVQCDKVIKAFNYFSHSVDRTVTSVDLNEFAEKMVVITKRLAKINGSDLLFKPETNEHLSLITNQFLFEQLYFYHLEHIIQAKIPDLKITLSASKDETYGRLIFSCSQPIPSDFAGNDYYALLQRLLKASAEMSLDNKTLTLRIEPLSV